MLHESRAAAAAEKRHIIPLHTVKHVLSFQNTFTCASLSISVTFCLHYCHVAHNVMRKWHTEYPILSLCVPLLCSKNSISCCFIAIKIKVDTVQCCTAYG